MSKLLVDSSIIVDFLRLKSKDSTHLQQLANQGHQLYISIITHAELYSGKSIWESTNAKKELGLVLSGLQVLKLDERISKKAGETRAKYGQNIPDAIIAATAIFHKLPLATLNIKDFMSIKNLKIHKQV